MGDEYAATLAQLDQNMSKGQDLVKRLRETQDPTTREAIRQAIQELQDEAIRMGDKLRTLRDFLGIPPG